MHQHLFYLTHVQGVGENQPTRIRFKSGEGKVEDLEVPGDAHAKEEADVDQHLVPLLVSAPAAGAIRARPSEILK